MPDVIVPVPDAIVLSAFLFAVAWGLRRSRWGAPPRREPALGAVAGVAAAIHAVFHTAAFAAPSMTSAALFVVWSWTFFGLWRLWAARGPRLSHGGGSDGEAGPDDGGGGRGGGGDGGDGGDGPRGGGDLDIDWDAFERDLAAYRRETGPPLSTIGSP